MTLTDEQAETVQEELDRLQSARERVADEWHELMKAHELLMADPPLRRNDTCPCGSKAKFKKCCGSAERRQHFMSERIRLQAFDRRLKALIDVGRKAMKEYKIGLFYAFLEDALARGADNVKVEL